MKNKFSNEFYDIYRNDIEDIFDNFEPYICNLKDWYFDQSVIFDDGKRVVFKSVFLDKRKIGNEIITEYLDGSGSKLMVLENSISLEENYFLNNFYVNSFKKIVFGDKSFSRECFVFVNNKSFKYKEIYDFDSNAVYILDNDFVLENGYDKSLDSIINESCDIICNSNSRKRL